MTTLTVTFHLEETVQRVQTVPTQQDETDDGRKGYIEYYKFFILSAIFSLLSMVILAVWLGIYSPLEVSQGVSGNLIIATNTSLAIIFLILLVWAATIIWFRNIFVCGCFAILFWISVVLTIFLSLFAVISTSLIPEVHTILFYPACIPVFLAALSFIIFVIYIVWTDQCPEQLW